MPWVVVRADAPDDPVSYKVKGYGEDQVAAERAARKTSRRTGEHWIARYASVAPEPPPRTARAAPMSGMLVSMISTVLTLNHGRWERRRRVTGVAPPEDPDASARHR